jgi:Flp pilus assembly protein TadG
MSSQFSRRSEAGQAIVLLVLALIGLMGFAALAIDGGNIFTEQRRAQSAADNAVLAAAYTYSQSSTVTYSVAALRAAALDVAAKNGFDNNGTTNTVTFTSPPTAGPYAGNEKYMQVTISETVPTALAHLVYSGPWQVRVEAYARGQRSVKAPPYSGQALMAINETACQALNFNGTGDLTIEGAGVFTNSTCNACGNQTGAAGVAQGASAINMPDGVPGAVGCWYDPHGNLSPPGVGGQAKVDGPTAMPQPTYDSASATDDCGPTQPAPSGNATIGPGTYAGLDIGSNKTVKMSPGIYCLTSGIDKIQGDLTSDLNGNGSQDAGEGVMIYILPSVTGTILDMSAQANIHVDAMQAGDWKGMVMYYGMTVPCSSIGSGTINGGGSTSITGTIFMPCVSLKINGNSGTTALNSQVVANTVELNGTGDVYIQYDPNLVWNYPEDPAATLTQ